MKKVNKNKKSSIVDLFTKKVNKKELPAIDTKTFIAIVKSNKKLEKEVEKLRYEIEKIEAPIYQAKMGGPSLKPKRFEEIHNKKIELEKKFRKKFEDQYIHSKFFDIEDTWAMESSVEIAPPPPPSPPLSPSTMELFPYECKTISVTVCKKEVCIDQPLPMYLDYIMVGPDCDGSFSRNGNKFILEDDVQGGYYYEYGMYHRTSQTHEGQINISASTEIAEDSKINYLSTTFIRQSNNNGICAGGEDFFGYPPNWGWGKGSFQFRVKSKKPGEGWSIEFSTGEIQYRNTDKVSARIACVSQVLGVYYDQGNSKTLVIHLHKSYPAGTQFIFEVTLIYWIKACGEYGHASSSYDLRVVPEIHIEACTKEWPDTITIDVPKGTD